MLVNSTDSRRDFQFTVPPSVVIAVKTFSACVCGALEKGKSKARKREKEEWSAVPRGETRGEVGVNV